jgi:hypothetical protein
MDFEHILKENMTLEWLEPWPGVDAEGREVTCHTAVRASAQHCVYIARHAHKDDASAIEMPDVDWLREFVVVHWAFLPQTDLPAGVKSAAGFLSLAISAMLQWADAVRHNRWKERAENQMLELVDQLSDSKEQFAAVMRAADDLKQFYNRQ